MFPMNIYFKGGISDFVIFPLVISDSKASKYIHQLIGELSRRIYTQLVLHGVLVDAGIPSWVEISSI